MRLTQILSADAQPFDQHRHQPDPDHQIDRIVVVPKVLQPDQNRGQHCFAFGVLGNVHDAGKGAADADLCPIAGVTGQ